MALGASAGLGAKIRVSPVRLWLSAPSLYPGVPDAPRTDGAGARPSATSPLRQRARRKANPYAPSANPSPTAATLRPGNATSSPPTPTAKRTAHPSGLLLSAPTPGK
jgi:hypothetical protein